MRESFVLAERDGALGVPYVAFAARLDDASVEDDAVAYERVARTCGGTVERRVTWHVERGPEETRVVETVRASRGWYLAVLAGMVAALVGASASATDAGSVALCAWALSALGVVGGSSASTGSGRLPAEQVAVERARRPQVGPLAVVWACTGAALLVGGRPGVALAGVGCVAWLSHGVTERVEDALGPVSDAVCARIRGLPVVASRYVAVAAAASAGLVAFGALNASIALRRPAVSLAVVVGAGALVASLLAWRGSRRLTPVRVVVAAAATGVVVLSIPWQVDVAIRPFEASSHLDTGLIVASAGFVAGGWALAWRGLFAGGEDTRRRFAATGRSVSTRVAAASAYATITSAGVLLAAILASVVVCWRLAAAGTPASVWLLGVALALPTAYLGCGAGYQLARLAAMVWTVRRRCDRRGLPADAVPFEPAYPVWVLPREAFHAGAYWDPFARAIVLSEGALDALEPAERAAVIAHEESHFEHRGAYLQFVLACLPSFALLGKNVVYSIYDFRAREVTADEYAVERVDAALADADGADVLVGVLRRFAREEWAVLEESAVTFLPTMQMGDLGRALTGVDRVFDFLFGYFAGGVHPSVEERIRAVRDREREGD